MAEHEDKSEEREEEIQDLPLDESDEGLELTDRVRGGASAPISRQN